MPFPEFKIFPLNLHSSSNDFLKLWALFTDPYLGKPVPKLTVAQTLPAVVLFAVGCLKNLLDGHTAAIPTLMRLEQEKFKFTANLGSIERPYQAMIGSATHWGVLTSGQIVCSAMPWVCQDLRELNPDSTTKWLPLLFLKYKEETAYGVPVLSKRMS